MQLTIIRIYYGFDYSDSQSMAVLIFFCCFHIIIVKLDIIGFTVDNSDHPDVSGNITVYFNEWGCVSA